MAQPVRVVPTGDMKDMPFSIQEWVRKVTNIIIDGTIGTTWALLDKTGSNLADLLTRNHNDLQNKQGGTSGEYYHATSAEYVGTGSGIFARQTSPSLVTPTLSTASPASNAAGTAGTIVWDASYIYICTASGVWKRAAITGGY